MIKPSQVFFILLVSACVDRLDIEYTDTEAGIIVVDGVITDQPGPYTIKIFRSSNADDIVSNPVPISARQVSIFSDDGENEILKSVGSGTYETAPEGIRGTVGKKYAVRIELVDGSIVESVPDELKPVAKIDSLYYLWETFKPLDGPTRYGFRVFMDSKGLEGENRYMRWRYSGTYLAEAYPKGRGINDNCFGVPDPPPCSGYTYTGTRQFPGDFVYIGECTCCICWVTDPEGKPQLNDKLNTNGTYKKIEVGYVPFNQWTFHFGRYMIKVEQMSLSDQAFEFWKIVRDQKEGITDLFQPAIGRLKTNIFAVDSNLEVSGIFYATSIDTKVRFLTRDDAEIPVPELNIDTCPLRKECDRAFPHASRTPPPEWE